MRIAICDDEEQYCTQLVTLLNEYAYSNGKPDISITVFSQARDFLAAVERVDGFDIYILDIVMPDVNGIDLGVSLRQNGYDGIIIYLTSSRDYAIDSYKVKAFHYILKPIVTDEFYSVLEEAFAAIADRFEKSTIVKTKEGNIRLSFNSILYIELCKRIIVYHLANGETVESIYLRIPFAEAVQEMIADNRFVLCSQCYIINLCHVSMVSTEEMIFKDTYKVYFGKKICGEVRPIWLDFWFCKEV